MELYNFDFSKKIFFHPGKVDDYKEGRRPFPVTLEVDLTNACNHRCSFCFYADNYFFKAKRPIQSANAQHRANWLIFQNCLFI